MTQSFTEIDGSANRFRSSYYSKLHLVISNPTFKAPKLPHSAPSSPDSSWCLPKEPADPINEYPMTSPRIKFLHSLTIRNMLLSPTMRPKTHQSVVIFDWDDTLLCTSAVIPSGSISQFPEIPNSSKEKLKELENQVCQLLELSINLGQVFIITNADQDWVERSALNYIPAVLPLLSKVKIVSARREFEWRYPGNTAEWKIQSFLNIKKYLQPDAITNIIAVGDNHIELAAACNLASKFDNVCIKTVKFRENPSIEELIKEVKLVVQEFNYIASNPKNLTIKLERKSLTENSNSQKSH